MSFIVLIPARLKSTRLPSKPLLDIGGKSLIQRVFENSSFSDAKGVFIATDHESIVENCNSFGAETILTNVNHHSGTDRLSEAASILGLKKETIIVNVQGDEALVNPNHIDTIVKVMKQNPDLMNSSRIKRISQGSGRSEKEIKELLNRYKQSKQMMKASKGRGMRQLMKRFGSN